MATIVLPSWSAETILVMAREALGFVLLESTPTATRTATSTAATSSGTIGGKVHLALSSSSVIGICPAWVEVACGVDGGAALGGLLGDTGLVSSGIGCSGNRILL